MILIPGIKTDSLHVLPTYLSNSYQTLFGSYGVDEGLLTLV